GLCWAVLYLSLGMVQHYRALGAAEVIVANRGHDPVRLEVKPGFANLLLWKAIYEYDERYFVDAVRVGISTSYFPGESIAKFEVSKDFPSLHADSQQARDISRFRWFSDDWLALDSQDNSVVVDMRYSQLPNAIKGLWGIRIRTDPSPDAHIEWVAQRETSATEVNALWQQIKGVGAKPLPARE
ncbi:MAG: metal-dependent hydrolase, partial [Halieaceae bacterium]